MTKEILSPKQIAKEINYLLPGMTFFRREAIKEKHKLPFDETYTECFNPRGKHRRYMESQKYIDEHVSDEAKNRLMELLVLIRDIITTSLSILTN